MHTRFMACCKSRDSSTPARSPKPFLWVALGLATAAVGYLAFLRPRHLKWGTVSGEDNVYLPGDELLTDDVSSATHAITIDAPPEDVWPWIAQIGQDKGGFYSYTMLENLVGCHMHNADEVRPEWQSLKQGDKILFHPEFPAQPVALLEPYRHLVIGSNFGKPDASTWAFVLRDLGNGRTRLIVRLRWHMHSGIARLSDLALLEPAHFVMERKMMLTIKKLAEDRARQFKAA